MKKYIKKKSLTSLKTLKILEFLSLFIKDSPGGLFQEIGGQILTEFDKNNIACQNFARDHC